MSHITLEKVGRGKKFFKASYGEHSITLPLRMAAIDTLVKILKDEGELSAGQILEIKDE